MNKGLVAAISAIGIAQLVKVPISYAKTRKLDIKQLVTTGSMPSSHSAGVSALATYVAMKKGIYSVDFALASLFGVIVMYDAMGIRRHAGEIAVEVNKLDEQVEELANNHPGIYHRKRDHELKEMLGHLPGEVVAGAMLGVLVGLGAYYLD